MKNIQHTIYKITSERIRYANWNVDLSYDLAIKLNELIALFDNQMFRSIKQISSLKPIENVVFIEMSNKKDFNYLCRHGFHLNNKHYKRFVGTTGGLKSKTIIFVNADIIDKLNEICENGRDIKQNMVVAKYEAYKALVASASIEVDFPNKILVVKDAFVKFKDDVIILDNSITDSPIIEYKYNYDLENNATDGFNLCTIEYMQKIAKTLDLEEIPSGVCIRAPWTKGMLFPFPIKEFAEKHDKFIVEDIWGNNTDIRDVDVILTESSLKLWSAYKSVDDYILNCKKNRLGFCVTKESGIKIDDEREINYQYLQSYDMSDDDIKNICEPTLSWLKGAMSGEHKKTIEFIGGNDEDESLMSWIKALKIDKRFLEDKYIINKIRRLIKKKIDDAKLGKLKIKGNYQTASGDPYVFMQNVLGLEVTGLLKANECYSSYWKNREVKEVLAFRSPMSCHNNIRRCSVVWNDEIDYWYQYMKNIFIVNSFDAFCIAENGQDYDKFVLLVGNDNVEFGEPRNLGCVS